MKPHDESCFDCERLATGAPASHRPHPYLVFSGKRLADNLREFMCVLCKSTFVFDAAAASHHTTPTSQFHLPARDSGQDTSA